MAGDLTAFGAPMFDDRFNPARITHTRESGLEGFNVARCLFLTVICIFRFSFRVRAYEWFADVGSRLQTFVAVCFLPLTPPSSCFFLALFAYSSGRLLHSRKHIGNGFCLLFIEADGRHFHDYVSWDRQRDGPPHSSSNLSCLLELQRWQATARLSG